MLKYGHSRSARSRLVTTCTEDRAAKQQNRCDITRHSVGKIGSTFRVGDAAGGLSCEHRFMTLNPSRLLTSCNCSRLAQERHSTHVNYMTSCLRQCKPERTAQLSGLAEGGRQFLHSSFPRLSQIHCYAVRPQTELCIYDQDHTLAEVWAGHQSTASPNTNACAVLRLSAVVWFAPSCCS